MVKILKVRNQYLEPLISFTHWKNQNKLFRIFAVGVKIIKLYFELEKQALNGLLKVVLLYKCYSGDMIKIV